MGRSKGKAPSTWRDSEAPLGGAGIRVCQRRQRAQPDTGRAIRRGTQGAQRLARPGASQCPQAALEGRTGLQTSRGGPPPDAEGTEEAAGMLVGDARLRRAASRDGHGGAEEKGLEEEEGHASTIMVKERKRRGRSAQRGRRETPSLDRDTPGGDGASSCLDSEAHEAQESRSQSGGTL